MNQVDNVLLPIEILKHTKLINAPRGSLVYESDGRVSLRADKGTGAGLAEQRFSVNPSTWEVDLLEQSDLQQREGVMIDELSFLVDPNTLKQTQPENHKLGDLIVSGSMVTVIAKAPNGSALPVILRATISNIPPLSYSGWSIGVTSPDGIFKTLFRQLDLSVI